MQNTYYSARFTSPANIVQDGYMVVDPSGNISFTDANGSALTLPRVYEYYITTPVSQSPAWGI